MATASKLKENVRGAGRPTAGASDTTMLIWQTIEKAGEQGVTSRQLFQQLEDRIPAGYALRRKRPENHNQDASGSSNVRRARRFVLDHSLSTMKSLGTVTLRSDRTYAVLRKPKYYGDEQKIDVDGDIAAHHMAVAEALRVLRSAAARNRKWAGVKRMHAHFKAEEMAALEVLLATFS